MGRRIALWLVAVAVTVVASACTGPPEVRTRPSPSPTPSPVPTPSPTPSTPRALATSPAARSYLDEAMRLIRDHDSYALGVAWPNLASEAARLAQGARRPADVYPTISTVLEYLDDPHGELVPPDERTTWTGRLHNMASMPTGRLVGVAGVLELPGLGFPPRSGRAKAYVHAAWRVLRSVHPADGWIIDLREDYGGDAIPMLAAVEPFLDCSRFLGFRDAAQGTTWFHVREGSVGVRGPRGTSTTLGAYGTPPPPIPGRLALLAGASTASSGEATLIALRCHQGASFIGEPTAGLTGSPSTFTLSDGAWLRLTTSVAVDGAGTVYGGTVEPDIPVESGSSVTDDPVLDRAVRFLASF